MGTRLGLARFDGVRFSVFNEARTGLAQLEMCKSLAEDSAGNLWIGTKKGLLCLTNGQFRVHSPGPGGGIGEVTALCAGTNGDLWIGTTDGVRRLQEGVLETFAPAGLTRQHVYALCADRAGRLWAGFSAGLFRLDSLLTNFVPVWKSERPWPEENFQYVKCIQEDERGQIWFGTNEALFSYDGQEVRQHHGVEGFGAAQARSIFRSREGRLWLLAGNEVFLQETNRFRPLGLASNWPSEMLRSIAEDQEGNIWLGTAYNGLQQLQFPPVVTLTTRDGLSHDDVWSICESQTGGMWIATSAGIRRYQEGQFQIPNTEADLARKSFRSVMEDRNGNLWLGTAFEGIMAFKAEKGGYRSATAVPAPAYSIIEAKDGTIWAGGRDGYAQFLPGESIVQPVAGTYVPCTHSDQRIFRSGRVARYLMKTGHLDYWFLENGVWNRPLKEYGQTFPASETALHDTEGWTKSIPSGQPASYDIRVVFEDRSGTLWFGTAGGGLNSIQDGAFRTFGAREGLASDTVSAIHQDSDGVLWIGTAGGLSRLDSGRCFNYTTRHGLPDHIVNNILEDDDGNLWIGSHRGIYRVQRQDLNNVAEGRAPSVKSILLDESNGLLSNETNGGCQPSACKSRDGKLWFATNRGVAVIDPSQVQFNDRPPPIMIEELRANNERVAGNEPVVALEHSPGARFGQGPVKLPPGAGEVIEIHYTAASLSAPEKVRFKYRLEGFDKNWIDAGARRVAYYTNLRPGQYQFRVKAGNNHDVWNETGAALAFQLAPRLTQTALFRIGSGASLLVALAGFYRWRLAKDRRIQSLEKNFALAQERERIARDMHDEIGSHLTLVTKRCEAIGQANKALAPPDLDPVIRLAREAEQKLDAIVWTAQPKNDYLDSLADYLSELATEHLGSSTMKLRLDLPDPIPHRPVGAMQRYHLLLTAKEALNNVLRHSGASQVIIRLRVDGPAIELDIEDNGRGFDSASRGHKAGNGIRNMEQRIESAGGTLQINSRAGQGTRVLIRLHS